MTYRSLLVLLDQDPLCESRTQVALRLARELDAHLVGLAPTGLVNLPVAAAMEAGGSEFVARLWEDLRSLAGRAAQIFGDQCRAAGIESFETVVDEADKARSVVRHAHCSDLAILSQPDPEDAGHSQARELLEQVILHSARPTLVLPYAGRFDTIGSKAMVAWNDSREAARALSDALPMLRKSRQVQLISWSEGGAIGDQKLRRRLEAVKQWLTYQGVAAEARIENGTGIDIDDAMLSRAADMDADLVVMGAYGRARWTERVLGGATRGLLQSMTVPVLMSH